MTIVPIELYHVTGIVHHIVKRMSVGSWFWITVIVLVIALVVRDILCFYWKCKYGSRPKNKIENKMPEAPGRTVIIGFSNKNKK